jgi:hypothetical protein
MTPQPPNEPVDEAVLEALTQQACFAADRAYFDHLNDVSSVLNPDGTPGTLTPAEMTRVQVHEAIRNLISNGLVVPIALNDWPEYTTLD